MHHNYVSRLDAQARFTFPFLEVGRSIDLVIAYTQSLEIYYHAWSNQLIQGNTPDILPVRNKV